MKKIIANLVAKYRQKKLEERNQKYFEIRYEWLKFFEQREKHLKGVQLPPFMLADQQMKIIEANNELDFYYKKIQKYKRQKAVA